MLWYKLSTQLLRAALLCVRVQPLHGLGFGKCFLEMHLSAVFSSCNRVTLGNSSSDRHIIPSCAVLKCCFTASQGTGQEVRTEVRTTTFVDRDGHLSESALMVKLCITIVAVWSSHSLVRIMVFLFLHYSAIQRELFQNKVTHHCVNHHVNWCLLGLELYLVYW